MHLLVETTEDVETTSKSIEAGVSLAFAKFGGEVNMQLAEKCKSLFREQKIRILVAGGPLNAARNVKDYDSFVKFLEMPSAKSLIEAAVPISYRVRTLRDNREVEVRACYTEERFVPEK